MVVLGEMGVQAHTMAASQLRRNTHEVLADRKWRTRCHRDIEHGAKRIVMVGLDEALGVLEDDIFFFHHVIGRQAALALTHTHTTARGHKAHTDGTRTINAVIQANPVRVDVQVVTGCGAATQ